MDIPKSHTLDLQVTKKVQRLHLTLGSVCIGGVKSITHISISFEDQGAIFSHIQQAVLFLKLL